MVLAAGRGERLRPLTDRLPKPMVPVGGRSMIDRVLDRLADAGVQVAVVNTWHRAEAIEAHLAARTRPRIVISREETLLNTGGGTVGALPHLGADPFYIAAAKMVWRDGARPALRRLAEAWNDGTMDGLLLLQPREAALGFEHPGDFFLADDGRLLRRGSAPSAPFAFTSLQLAHPRVFADPPPGAFSLNLVWDRAIAAGRLHGLVHDGDWCNVSSPGGLALAEARSWDG
ncbi:MAG: nucleotidyltransferase family protein [Alphaproteobacteria bacterium]|nr:nucleotidyltransferase family protein [Alphaproteobacteria bacterium]